MFDEVVLYTAVLTLHNGRVIPRETTLNFRAGPTGNDLIAALLTKEEHCENGDTRRWLQEMRYEINTKQPVERECHHGKVRIMVSRTTLYDNTKRPS